jgi:hypothetical protein
MLIEVIVGKKILLLILLFAAAASGFCLDFNVRPRGFAFIPLGEGNIAEDGNKRYSVGGGGDIGFEIDLASVWSNPLGLGYTAGIEGALQYNPYEAADGGMQFFSGGLGLGVNYFPLSRLYTRMDLGLGVYQASDTENSGNPGFWWSFGGEAGFRFTPSFTLAANMGWRQFRSSSGGTFNSGLYMGLTAQISFELGERRGGEGAGAVLDQDDGVYPVFLSMYQQNPLGTIIVRNNENAEIRNVRVSFRAGNYTASEFACGALPLLPKGRSTAVPLYADFSPEIFNFTDNGRILGEIIIRYSFLGKERTAARTVTVAVHNRNMFPPADMAALAAFVSPTSPEVLEFSK